MDNFYAPTEQSELIAAGLNPTAPATTATDFAHTIAQNQLQQQNMEAQVARAQELAKQAKFGTETQGAGFMSPTEANTYVKAALTAKGDATPEVLAAVDAWTSSLNPDDVVDQNQAETFLTRLMGMRVHLGTATPLTAATPVHVPIGKSAADLGLQDQKDGDGKSVDDTAKSDGTFTATVPSDGMYQVAVDNNGVPQSYNNGGKIPADTSDAKAQTMALQKEKMWATISAKADPYMASSRNAIGVLTQSMIRCNRALESLEQPTVTKQTATFVLMEIGAIYKGGSPDEASLLATQYPTLYGYWMDRIQQTTGTPKTALPQPTLDYLIQQVEMLKQQTVNQLNLALKDFEMGPGASLVDLFPERWAAYKETILQNQNSADNKINTPGTNVTEADAAAVLNGASPSQFVPAGTSSVTPVAPAMGAPAPLKTKSGHSYTVSQ